jgi:hypothetical protein
MSQVKIYGEEWYAWTAVDVGALGGSILIGGFPNDIPIDVVTITDLDVYLSGTNTFGVMAIEATGVSAAPSQPVYQQRIYRCPTLVGQGAEVAMQPLAEPIDLPWLPSGMSFDPDDRKLYSVDLQPTMYSVPPTSYPTGSSQILRIRVGWEYWTERPAK